MLITVMKTLVKKNQEKRGPHRQYEALGARGVGLGSVPTKKGLPPTRRQTFFILFILLFSRGCGLFD